MKETLGQKGPRLRVGRPGLGTNLVLFAGLLMTAGLPPFRWTGLLVPAGMALLFGVLLTSLRPGRTAWYFGLAHQATLLYWLFLLDPSKTIPTRALVPIQASAAILYVSCFYLVLGWAYGRLRDRLGNGASFLMLPVLWVAMEALRARGELAFSWCLSGAAVIGSPLLFVARSSGEIGVGAGLAFLAAAGAGVWATRRGRLDGTRVRNLLLAEAGVIWAALLTGSVVPVPPASESSGSPESLQVAAVQADVPLAVKWVDAEIEATKEPYADLTREAAAGGADFVVWAETAVPAYLRYDQDLLKWIRELVRDTRVWLYTGFPDADRDPEGRVRTYNSSGLLDPGGQFRDQYAKHHLLPIGESMPFTSLFPFLAKLDVGQAEWTPGAPPEPMTVTTERGEFRFSGLVCFESIFSHLARYSVRRGSQCLVVITNDGWFGKSAGPRQHTWQARMRAVECGVPVIRCANNGISFVCDAEGRYLARLGLGRKGIAGAEIRPGEGRTPYVALGAWPLFGLLVLFFLFAFVSGWRRSTAGKDPMP